VFARLALIAGAYVEWGGSPLLLAENAPVCALLAMQLSARFSQLWPIAGGGRPEPITGQEPAMSELTGLFRRGAPWPVGAGGGRDRFRAAAGLLPEIGEAATQLGDSVPRAH
jgi:hypothetical protein